MGSHDFYVYTGSAKLSKIQRVCIASQQVVLHIHVHVEYTIPQVKSVPCGRFFTERKPEKWNFLKMNNTNNITDSENCFPYESTKFQAVTLLSSSVALVSALACILVTVGIIYFKKYLFFTQRLILYLSIAATLNSMAIMLRFHSAVHGTDTGSQKHFCTASAFLEQISGWWATLGCLLYYTQCVCESCTQHQPRER